MSRGVLLINLGTPSSPAVNDVRHYLREFLTDPYVIDLPVLLRHLIVRGFILPFRPRRSAAAYARIWDAAGPGTGSPLLHYSHRLHEALGEALGEMPCELAMRYGEPDIRGAVENLYQRGVHEVLMIALYPQHADSTRETSIGAVRSYLPDNMQLRVLPPFFADPAYIDVQAALIRRHLPESWDHLLFSYHGLPERHLQKADPTGSHCLQSADCCEVPSAAHATCYRHQVRETSRLLTTALSISEDNWSVSFQSRLGRLPWLTPYTDEVLGKLPGQGVKDLAVACPAFVADNLETLEEIGMAGREKFIQAGGRQLTLIPCLNDDAEWVRVLASWAREGLHEDQTNAARSDTAR
jgi:ferrochelatase